jgi:uncharacterized protein (DUF1778 family)
MIEPLVIRLSPADRHILAAIAALFDTDLAGYAEQLLHRQAEVVRRQSPSIHLSRKDFAAFMKLGDHPAKPNAALRRAFQHSLRLLRGGDKVRTVSSSIACIRREVAV